MAEKAAGRNSRAAVSSSAVRASGERDRAAGIITNRAYTIPPTSVTADVRCTHRMMAVRNSPIWVSILALWPPYDPRDPSGRHVAVQLLNFRRRNHAPGHGDRSRRRDRPHPGSPGEAPPHRHRHRDHARPHRSHRRRPKAQTGHWRPGIYEPRGHRTPGHARRAGRLARRTHSRRRGDRRPGEGWRQTPRRSDRSTRAPHPGPHAGQHLPLASHGAQTRRRRHALPRWDWPHRSPRRRRTPDSGIHPRPTDGTPRRNGSLPRPWRPHHDRPRETLQLFSARVVKPAPDSPPGSPVCYSGPVPNQLLIPGPEIREMGRAALDFVAEYYDTLDTRAVLRPSTSADVRRQLDEPDRSSV